jgi:hypothetical protein
MFGKYRSRSRMDALIKQWTEYRRLALTRLGAGDVRASEERSFLQIKGRIAEALAALSMDLGQAAAQEVQVHLRAISDLLGRFPSLYADHPLDADARENFEHNWHDHYLFFNKLKGLQSRQEPDSGPKPAGTKTIHRRSGGVRFGIVFLRLAMVVALVYALVRFIPWHRLGSGSAEAGAGGFTGFVSEAWESVKLAVANVSLPSLGKVFSPAVERYGPEVTTILLAVLFLALGYWIFIRMK